MPEVDVAAASGQQNYAGAIAWMLAHIIYSMAAITPKASSVDVMDTTGNNLEIIAILPMMSSYRSMQLVCPHQPTRPTCARLPTPNQKV
eukprot:scaffold329496_cov18-Prasinocladus_malaysianus.AAC.1